MMKNTLPNFPRFRRFALALILLPIFGSLYPNLYAQQPQPPAVENQTTPAIREHRIIVQGQGEHPMPPMPPMPPGVVFDSNFGNNFMFATGEGGTFNFLSSEMNFDMRTVKGAPYTADAVTETIQVLADGNRIVRRTTFAIARDGEGRTRREQAFGMIGNFAPANPSEAMRSVFINDPVARTNFVLEPRTRTARKTPYFEFSGLPTGENFKFGKPGDLDLLIKNSANLFKGEPERIVIVKENKNGVETTKEYKGKEADEYLARERGKISGAARVNVLRKAAPQANTEKLGTETIEGVEAEGTRTTTTIEAGKIGNERPIVITSERWYSPQLQTVVMTKRNDPRHGETIYKLTNINRSEPARTLFEVPSDYKVEDAPARPFRIRKPREE